MLSGDERDGSVTTNRRQIAFVSVAEWHGRLAGDSQEDVAGGSRPGLDCRRRNAGDGLSTGRHCREIADDEDLGMTRDAQIRSDEYATDPVQWSVQEPPDRKSTRLNLQSPYATSYAAF